MPVTVSSTASLAAKDPIDGNPIQIFVQVRITGRFGATENGDISAIRLKYADITDVFGSPNPIPHPIAITEKLDKAGMFAWNASTGTSYAINLLTPKMTLATSDNSINYNNIPDTLVDTRDTANITIIFPGATMSVGATEVKDNFSTEFPSTPILQIIGNALVSAIENTDAYSEASSPSLSSNTTINIAATETKDIPALNTITQVLYLNSVDGSDILSANAIVVNSFALNATETQDTISANVFSPWAELDLPSDTIWTEVTL